MTSPKWNDEIVKRTDRFDSLRVLSVATVTAIFVQLLLGALMRHKNAGLAIPTYPFAPDGFFPDFTSIGVVLNFAHRWWAIVVAALIYTTNIRALSSGDRSARTPAFIGIVLVLVQITLGAVTIWTEKDPNWTSLHVVNGAAVLMTEFILAVRVHHSFARREAEHTVTHSAPMTAASAR